MFRRLGEFSYQRSLVQAIGFYLVYFFTGVIVSGLLGAAFGVLSGANGFDEGLQVGMKVGMVFGIFLAAVLSFMILRAKGLLRHVGYLLVGLLSVVAAYFGGMLLGLLVVAFLTTRPVNPEIDATARPIEGPAAL